MKRACTWMLWLAVAAAPWLTGLRHPFLYDDIGMIAENEFLAEPANLGRVLSGRTLGDPRVVNGRRPAVLATYFLDRALHGLRPAGWRLTSLLLHLGCAGLLMGVLRRLGGREFFLLAAGWVFALHPALVEAVHAPGFRADVLCLFFMLAALHGFLSVRHHPALGLASGIGFMALALLSKETALALPLALGAVMVAFPSAFPADRRRCMALWALAGGVAAGFFVLWLVLPAELQSVGGSWNGLSLRHPENLYSVGAVWARTLRLLVAPWPLNVTPWFGPVSSSISYRFIWGLVLLGGSLGAAWGLRRRFPWAALGLAWMIVFFLPVSNLWPLFHPVAERYLYPLAPGFAMLAAWVLSSLPTARRLVLAVVAAVLALGVAGRVAEWRSAEALWSSAYARNPRSATAATWLGLLREEAGEPAVAREYYAAAVAANPQAAAAWINWGILEGRAGNWAESERLLRRAVEVRPDNAKGWHNLALCLEAQGRMAEAAAAAERAAALR